MVRAEDEGEADCAFHASVSLALTLLGNQAKIFQHRTSATLSIPQSLPLLMEMERGD